MNGINWLITAALILAGVGWWFWGWYVKPSIARGKWEAERRQAKLEERAAHQADLRKAAVKHQEAAYSQAAMIDMAERAKRQRNGENAIYDDMRGRARRRFLDNRSGGTNNSTNLL